MNKKHIAHLRAAGVYADELSHCQRKQVGCVITTSNGLYVLGIGVNGNYAGGPNACDDPSRPGQCGCIHAEENALLKSDNSVRDKVVYTTAAPCLRCAKRIINAGVAKVVYSDPYNYLDGIMLLRSVGIDDVYVKLST